jgi:hypothetical protein
MEILVVGAFQLSFARQGLYHWLPRIFQAQFGQYFFFQSQKISTLNIEFFTEMLEIAQKEGNLFSFHISCAKQQAG